MTLALIRNSFIHLPSSLSLDQEYFLLIFVCAIQLFGVNSFG